MNSIKIAVLDTGLDIEDSEIKKFCTFNKSLQLEMPNINMQYMSDLNGHGTLVAKTIVNVCNNVEILPVKIFNESGRTNSYNTILALEKILNSDVKLINISASTFDYTYKNEFENICDKLKESKKIVICSKHNNKNLGDSIPTIFESVIGVEGHRNIYENSKYLYKSNKKVQMSANSKECFMKFKDKVTYFGKNSKACAVATGIIANLIQCEPDINISELEKIIIETSCSEKDLQINTKININDKSLLDIKYNVLNIINTNFSINKVNLDFIEKYGLMNNTTNIYKHNAYDFLEKINNYFNIKIHYTDIFLYQLSDINNLSMIISMYLN